MEFAVCYTTQDGHIQKWTVVTAENAGAAAIAVREKNSLCSIRAVYKRLDDWRWNWSIWET